MMMEFLEGEPLEAVMGREGQMSPARALPLIDEILSALSAAHKAGVVHRDLKPSNVFISMQTSGDRTVKVLDFGLAKHAPIALGAMSEEQVGAKSSLMAGTPEYIAPEQARGLAATPQTDLYCLGVMLFEMLSGELPFRAENSIELMKKHVYEAPPRVSRMVGGLPESLDALVAVLLEKDPEKRPPSADVARQTVLRIMRELREQSTHQAPNPLLASTAAAAAVAPPVDDPISPRVLVTRSGATTSRLPERVQAEPVRRSDRSVWAILLLLLLFLFGSLGVWMYSRADRSAPIVSELQPQKTAEPIVPVQVAKPTVAVVRPVEPIGAAVEPVAVKPTQEEIELVGLGKKLPKSHQTVVNPDTDCIPDDDWRRGEVEFARKIGETYRLQVYTDNVPLNTQRLAQLDRITELVSAADDQKKCATAAQRLLDWQKANIHR